MAAHQFLPCATNEIFCKKCGLLTEAVEGTRVPCKELGHSFVSHPKRQSFFCERCGRASDADTSLPCLFPAPSHQNTFHLPEPSKRHLSSDSDDKPTNTKRQKQSSRPPAPSPSPTPSAADEYLSEDGDRDADEDMKSANSSTQLRFAPNVFQDFTTTRWRFSLLGDAVTAAVYDLGTETYETEAAAKASQAALLETFAKLGDRSWENLIDRFAMAFKLRNQQSLRGDVSNGVDKVVIMESPGVSDYYLFAFQTCGPAQLSKNEDYSRLKSAHVTEPTEVQPIMTKLGTHITEKLLPTWSGKLTKTATASFQHSSSTLSSPSHSSSERKVAADAVKASSRFIPMEQLNDESPTVGFMYLALRLPRDTPRGVYFQVHDAVRSAF